MSEKRLVPDFIFESSWEVCNKMGGIYTVLSTRAKTLQEQFRDKLVFIGPDLWLGKENPLFAEDTKLWPAWTKKAAAEAESKASETKEMTFKRKEISTVKLVVEF